MNNIIDLFNIEDDDIIVVDSYVEDSTKFIVIQKKLKKTFCPNCGCVMHSKGLYERHINHSMLQDGFNLTIILHQRKWRCTNKDCNTYKNKEFSFVEPSKRQSNLLPFMILNALKNPHNTFAQVARMFNVSDSYVHDVFTAYVDVKRLPLPEILVIDEVFLNIEKYKQFVCVLLDFKTGEIVDILPNRWKTTLDSYFTSIPREEKNNVKFLISDMYDTYINLKKDYFPNAVGIIDSFHVLSNLENKLNTYLNSVKRKYQEKEKKVLEEKNLKNNKDYKSQKKSKEINILNNYAFFLLKDKDDIDYRPAAHYNKIVKYYASTWDLENEFMKLDPRFPILSELKQKYIEFNKTKFDSPKEIEPRYNEIIREYKDSGDAIFIDFARLLERYRTPILASFNYVEVSKGNWKRLSSGIIEGFNRLPKDMKREARGYEIFEVAKSRIIYANRKSVPIRVIPKEKSERKRSERAYRKKRGKYNKNK